MEKNQDIKKEIWNKFIQLFKEFIRDILAPFIFIIKWLFKFYNTFFIYFKDHKEFVIIITYSLWLLLQLFFLYVSFWIEWLSFISIKFSLILLVILFFLSFLSFPVLLLFFLFTALIMFFWLLWVAVALWTLFFIFSRFFPKISVNKKVFDKIEDKMWFLYIVSTVLIIIVFWFSFISQFSTQKPIELFTEKQGKVMGELLFYNQDYYFINSCNEKIIIPSNQVISTHFLCLIKECSKERTVFINQSYKNYCDNLINNK